MAVASTPLSEDPVFKPKYNATVDIRSLKEMEVVSESVMIWQKKIVAIKVFR